MVIKIPYSYCLRKFWEEFGLWGIYIASIFCEWESLRHFGGFWWYLYFCVMNISKFSILRGMERNGVFMLLVIFLYRRDGDVSSAENGVFTWLIGSFR